jgi:hypothetical protein
MIKAEDILNATHGGLDIILDCYPQAKDCVNAKKHFSIRDERTPSASIRQYDSQKYGRIWQVTDFGGEGRGENAISIYMNYKGMRQNQFNEALLQLAAKFGVTDELNHSVNKPDIRKRVARQDEPDGTRSFELNDAFTEDELRILGPRVTQGDADALHWHSVKWITTVKNREVLVKSSNSHYPIFMRECLVKPANGEGEEEKFYKVYEPLNCDKGFRFSYTPAGKKPQRYINGLSELKEAYRQYNEEEERAWNSCHDDCKPYRTKKLPEAFICSGERDSLCCRSMGFHPLWFNSETYRLSAEEYREIMTYVEVLYNIPDIDETGIRKGRELALTYIDIRTIWLPKWLQTYHDNRGKSRKDLRDWMEIRSEKRNFKDLMNLAYPARFWEVFYTDKGKAKYEINTAYLYNFLTLNGYFILRDENSDTSRFIHIDGNIVEQIKVTDIREFVRTWVTDRHEEVAVVNLVLGTSKLFPASLESLDRVTLDFTSFTPTSQFFFFPNATVEVHKPVAIGDDGFKVRDRNSDHFSNFVWKENVIGHQFKKMDPMFKIKEVKEEGRKPYYDIDIHNVDSHFFGYLINTSRLFWRKETEINFNERPEEERQAYLEAHPFDIAGEGLSDLEIWEQKQNLINKIFTFGYMLHRYKDFVRAWAPMAMDNKIGENDECNGRSGKSFFFRVLSFMMKTVKLSGRNPKLMDNPHVFDQVTQDTDLLLVDDCDRYLNLGLFYDNITSDMTVNLKNNHSFTIGFDDSPKLAFTTNYVPTDFDPSSEARSLYMVFSDWYHQKTEENDYYDNRSIRDDFGKTLYAYDYTEEEWNADLNFWLQCCQFYLSVMDSGVKPQPPMENIIRRKYKADMGTNFEDWANGYFSMEGEHLDEYLERDVVFSDYARYANVNRITMQSFTKKMKAFCEFCPWIEEMNPKDLLNSSGRIQRKVEVAPGKKVVKDMIYVRSKPANEMDIAPDTPKEQSLFEDSDAPF